MHNLFKSHFLLDPSIHFLNHGSFGACPRPVFEVYQDWQRRLENQPVLFLGRQQAGFDRLARQALGEYLHTAADNLVFIPNATYGVNSIARSLALGPGDEILTSNHEYGACDYTWEFVCAKTGARLLHQALPLPTPSAAVLLEQFWQGVSERTRLIYLSHITSPTALRLPIEAICARARAAGIMTLIDGAHAPGQTPLHLDDLGADFYTGNCHKWLLAPKGAAFLYARPERQALVEPLVVSWGFHATPEISSGSQFVDYYQWPGTHDPAASLSVPAALQFMQTHNWPAVQADCHNLLRSTLQRLCDLTGLPPLYPLDGDLYQQMGIAPLPAHVDLSVMKARLYDEYQVEVPLIDWQGHKFVRVSVQAYNTPADLEALISGIRNLI